MKSYYYWVIIVFQNAIPPIGGMAFWNTIHFRL